MTLARTSRMLLLYSALVAPPLGGLFVILHFGAGLSAPRAIGGTWVTILEGKDSCTTTGSAASIEMTVSQSGPRAELTFSDTYPPLSIAVEGDRLVGAKHGAPGSCRDIALDARIATNALIEGTVRHPSCGECPIIHFHAERKAARAHRGSKP